MGTTRKSAKKRYAHPPIEEVSCELHFFEGKATDIALPGRTFDKPQLASPSQPRAMPADPSPGSGAT